MAQRNGIQILFSPIGIVMATMAVSLPYVLRSVLPVLVEVGKDQEDAARTLGAGPFRTFWQVTLPAIRWGVLYGVTLTIARTLGEFGAVLVVSGNITGQDPDAADLHLRRLGPELRHDRRLRRRRRARLDLDRGSYNSFDPSRA